MDERDAALIAEGWRGGAGLVSRGPRWLLGFGPATPEDAERHTGRTLHGSPEVWRVDIGGRFLQAGGLVYPGGVPYPDELAGTTALLCSEVWLYVDVSEPRLLGAYWWPEAVRRPIAARPEAEFDEDDVVAASEAGGRLRFPLRLPAHPGWDPRLVGIASPQEALVFCLPAVTPEPLVEMVVLAAGGLTLRVTRRAQWPEPDELLALSSPPFRPIDLPGARASGREPGRALGPHTWPWPGELVWRQDGLRFALKGVVPLSTLGDVARTVRPV